jgi:ABC-type uncharacterized transport system permease subunit
MSVIDRIDDSVCLVMDCVAIIAGFLAGLFFACVAGVTCYLVGLLLLRWIIR